MYSLVNVATVVRDLARHPDAPRVVDDLLRAFALDGAALAAIDAAPLDEAERARVRAAVAADLRGRPRALDVLAATRSVAETEGMRAWSVALDVLEDAAIGDCEELAAFVRREVLVDAWDSAGDLAVARHPRAIATVADGVAAAYAAPWSEAALALGAPWRRWLA